MKKELLAKWLHDTYEAIAKEKNWNTQQRCKVEFEDLPEANKLTMIEVSDKILNFDLLRLHFIEINSFENKSKCECGQKMQFNDGCVMGAYGVDYENCADPVYVCRCGNEPEPPTTSNSEYITCARYKR